MRRLVIVDEYHKSWALRYLREAKSDLETAKEAPYMEPNLLMESLKKVKLALHYVLGEPHLINGIVHATILSEGVIDDPVLQLLVEVEEVMNEVASSTDKDKELIMEYVESLLNFVSDVVNLFLGGDFHKNKA